LNREKDALSIPIFSCKGLSLRRLVVLISWWDGNELIADSNRGDLKTLPIQVFIQLIGDVNLLGRGRSCCIIFKIDAIGDGT